MNESATEGQLSALGLMMGSLIDEFSARIAGIVTRSQVLTTSSDPHLMSIPILHI